MRIPLVAGALTVALASALAGAVVPAAATSPPLPERTYLPLVGRTVHRVAAYVYRTDQAPNQIALSATEYGPGGTLSLPMACGFEPRWSPDGAAIACATQQCDRSGCRSTGLHVAGLDGSHLHIPAGDDDFAWSPDGRQLAFWGDALTVIGVDGSPQAGWPPLASPPPSPYQARPIAWSPDGQSIAAVIAGETDGAGLYVLRFGASPTLIAKGVDTFAWSPDSRRLAVARNFEAAGSTLSVVSATGGPELPLATEDQSGGGFRDQELAWSPDGALLAFARDETLDTGVYLARLDGSQPERLGSGSGVLAWSPDGTRLAYRGYSELQIVSIASGERVERFNGGSIAWSPDGALIAAGERTILTIAPWAAGDAARLVLFTGDGELQGLRWSPDGAWVAMVALGETAAGRQSRMVAVSRDGRRVVELGPGSAQFTWVP